MFGFKKLQITKLDSSKSMFFSDKEQFLLPGNVNSTSNIFWETTPREHCLQRRLNSLKCTAWVAVSKHGIIVPFWFEDDNEHCVTINTLRYVQMLHKCWTTLVKYRHGPPVVPAGRCHPIHR